MEKRLSSADTGDAFELRLPTITNMLTPASYYLHTPSSEIERECKSVISYPWR